MRVLVTGWFSFKYMGNTAGDMISKNVVCSWLDEADISYDVAMAAPFAEPGSVIIEETIPELYTALIFVCGPFGNGSPITEMLNKFAHARLIGVNISLLQKTEDWNPFTFLYERDSNRRINPDLTFLAPSSKVPVAGLILVHKQKEYGERAKHDYVHNAILSFLKNNEISVVRIDTCLENNEGGLKTYGEIESVLSKMDFNITTRLHGTVLSIKNGIPVIPVDPISGGAKITSQVNRIKWPVLLDPENISDQRLNEAVSFCRTNEARIKAAECAGNARVHLEDIHRQFLRDLTSLK